MGILPDSHNSKEPYQSAQREVFAKSSPITPLLDSHNPKLDFTSPAVPFPSVKSDGKGEKKYT